MSSAKTLEASGSESTLDGSGNDSGDDLKNEGGHQSMPGPQVLILVQEIEDDGQSENDDKSTKDSESDQLVYDSKDDAPTTILASDSVLEVEEHHIVTYLHLEDMDPNHNLIEIVGIHLEEIERTADAMVEILSKHISTNQFSKLISETDDMCFRSQEVFQFEMERRRKWRIEAGLNCQEEQSSAYNFGQSLEAGKERVTAKAIQTVENNEDSGGSDAESTLMSLEEALKDVIVDERRVDRGRPQRNVDSKDRTSRHPREADGPSEKKYRYRGPPGKLSSHAMNSLDASPQDPHSAEMLEDHQNNLKDYVRQYHNEICKNDCSEPVE